jgi:Lon protease-like protein
MTRSQFDPAFEDLPRIIPIFPLTGALLLPGGQLPLNIFEPRYLNMVQAALATEPRMIGMIQPTEPDLSDNRGPDPDTPEVVDPEFYRTGCGGRIISFSETEDGRYQIALAGMCRFHVVEELAAMDGYRRVMADYHRFRRDMRRDDEVDIDRERLLTALRAFLDRHGIAAEWDTIETTPDERLVTSLAMTCPFGPGERQALLEAPDLNDRGRILTTLLEMSLLEGGGAEGHA